jgi:hypothetical protein
LDADLESGQRGQRKGSSINTVLSGGLFAAICGPSLASYSRALFSVDFVGSYLVIGGIGLCNQLLLSFIPFGQAIDNAETRRLVPPPPEEGARPLRVIFSQPLFLLACGTAAVSNAAMVMVMSQFSIDMDKRGYPFPDISFVLELHLLAMYSPSFFTGHVLDHISVSALSAMGIALSLLGLGVLAQDWQGSGRYLVGMALIGVAWNFSYSSSSLMLGDCYRVWPPHLCSAD